MHNRVVVAEFSGGGFRFPIGEIADADALCQWVNDYARRIYVLLSAHAPEHATTFDRAMRFGASVGHVTSDGNAERAVVDLIDARTELDAITRDLTA